MAEVREVKANQSTCRKPRGFRLSLPHHLHTMLAMYSVRCLLETTLFLCSPRAPSTIPVLLLLLYRYISPNMCITQYVYVSANIIMRYPKARIDEHFYVFRLPTICCHNDEHNPPPPVEEKAYQVPGKREETVTATQEIWKYQTKC